MSTNIEVCHIRLEDTREKKRGRGWGKETYHDRYIAEVIRPSGKEIIAHTTEFLSYYSDDAIDARNQMIQQLLNDGWEVMTTNDRGEVQSLKRQLGTAPSDSSASPANLLKQLALLRDEGILTDEEFQVKKAEILRRM